MHENVMRVSHSRCLIRRDQTASVFHNRILIMLRTCLFSQNRFTLWVQVGRGPALTRAAEHLHSSSGYRLVPRSERVVLYLYISFFLRPTAALFYSFVTAFSSTNFHPFSSIFIFRLTLRMIVCLSISLRCTPAYLLHPRNTYGRSGWV